VASPGLVTDTKVEGGPMQKEPKIRKKGDRVSQADISRNQFLRGKKGTRPLKKKEEKVRKLVHKERLVKCYRVVCKSDLENGGTAVTSKEGREGGKRLGEPPIRGRGEEHSPRGNHQSVLLVEGGLE